MKDVSRRKFLGSTAAVVAMGPSLLLAGRSGYAAAMPKLDPNDPQAKALSYVHESPKPENLCLNCQLYSVAEGTEWGGCALFPGKQVAAAGWCSAWVKKAG